MKKTFYEDAKIQEESNYKNGVRDGNCMWYLQSGNVSVEYIDMNTGLTSFTNLVPVYINGVIGIKEQEKKYNSISIFPNPVSNTLYLSENKKFEKSQIEIVNYLGQTVLKTPFNNEIDVSQFSRGLYILKISSAQNNFTTKFIKQ